jgi:mannose-6-phosphate isomerase-like protein (cupin superfamily)
MDREPFITNVTSAPQAPLRRDRGHTVRLVDGELGTARNVDLHVNELSPGSGPGPRHYHRHAENVYVVLSGVIDVEIEGSTHRLGADDVLFIPPGRIHATSNPGEKPARFIEIYAPAGADFHIVDEEESS